MAQYGSGGDYPYPYGGHTSPIRPDLRHQSSSVSAVSSIDPDHDLRHQPSNISDVSSLDGSGIGHRMSVVSLPSPSTELPRSQTMDDVDISRVRINRSGPAGILPDALRITSPTSPSTRNYNPFRAFGQTYEPIAPPSGYRSPVGKSTSRRYPERRRSSLRHMRTGSIPETEEIDMSLLGSAMSMGYGQPKAHYSTVEEEEMPILSSMPFDVSSFTGPPQNEEQLREAISQESAGILTGGLGAGLKPGTTITSTDLMANVPPPTPTGVSRRLSFRPSSFRTPSVRSQGLGRTPTVRELGQIEANKRGEIIEVIVEEPTIGEAGEPAVDISSFVGGSTSTVDFDHLDSGKQSRKSTMAAATVEIFYPQANWKPFSMRWPYLLVLSVLSAVLAAAQEYLLRKSDKKPLYTFKSAADLNTWDYFSFKYLPTLIAVSFGVLWQVTDFEVKRLEAYYQLSKKGGALAAESINVDYITFFNFLRPAKALRFKHYAVAVSSMATLIAVSLLPTLQAATISLTPDRATRVANGADGFKHIKILAVWSRMLSAVLVLLAIMGGVLIWQLERRPSGLVADVKGIAGIAAMANRSHILMDFKDLDTSPPDMIHEKLKTHRYSLRNSSLAPEESVPLTQAEKDKYNQQNWADNPHPLMLRLIAGIPFVIGMILFMIVIPIILFQPNANVVTDKAPWLLTVFAVCIKLAWGTLETDVRMIEPFYILSRRHASSRVLTLDYTALAFGWLPIKAFLNGHALVALVGLGSVLAEVLTICSTSFASVRGGDFIGDQPPPPKQGEPAPHNGANTGEETFHSFWLSFGLAIAILTYLCLVAVLVYWRRRHPFLPRQPNTIASILAFIHQSKMLYDFVGTEKMNNDEMVQRLGSIGKTYGLGWFTGRDGEMHCGVDEEELVSTYKHGDDARQASQPWRSNWENY